MATVLDVINLALKEIGVLEAGETATADDSTDGLVTLNHLMDGYAAERLQIYKVTRTTWTIVSGTQTYTIGTGGDVNIARPVYIDHVTFIDTSPSKNIEYQLSPLTEDAWARVPIKTLQSPFPTAWYEDAVFPLRTLSFWPVPTSSTLLGGIYVPTAVAEFSATSTAISLPPGYRRMLVKGLAVEMLPSYGRQPHPALLQAADEAKEVVKRTNTRLLDMNFEGGSLIQGRSRNFVYNILTGP